MVNAHSELKTLKERQQAWARLNNCAFDTDGYCLALERNLFSATFSTAARTEFSRGSGAELGIDGARGKFQALHSSSALACNWFDFWRDRDKGPLAVAMGLPHVPQSLQFEAKFGTGVPGSVANLDVLLTNPDGSIVAIESKFAEPYTPSDKKFSIKEAYFDDNMKRWADAGLPHAQQIAERLRSRNHGFQVLDVAQLLKHMLALSRTGRDWALYCLWFEVAGQTATQHREDLELFSRLLDGDGKNFSALTYQELFHQLKPLLSPEHGDYANYISSRYIETA